MHMIKLWNISLNFNIIFIIHQNLIWLLLNILSYFLFIFLFLFVFVIFGVLIIIVFIDNKSFQIIFKLLFWVGVCTIDRFNLFFKCFQKICKLRLCCQSCWWFIWPSWGIKTISLIIISISSLNKVLNDRL